MIVSFNCKDTETLYRTGRTVRWSGIVKVATRKLQMLESASKLIDLCAPPGNRLEGLNGNRAGQHSIRINEQWRVCFSWTENGPANVEIVDYH
ncbi:type II toxin-antitoxin system RelE/ParE family toxin [Pseudomonas sp. DC3000-4b1]|uniref:type II toxin-antitoxin system RelE/ParE family toxin n=1 Tax=unclassified Pseudomonas TaxID=196821 RepID=UPI003CEC23D1